MTEEQQKIFNGLTKDFNGPERNVNDHILILDGLNTMLRAFSVVTFINAKGNNTGAISGFLKSLGSVIRQFNPTRVVVAWDGKGGSINRKYVNPSYKAQRNHTAVIHWDIYDTKDDEKKSIETQAERIVDYLACLPVTYIQIPKVEADDIIAYLALNASKVNHKVTIVSMDKDFMQLIDSNIRVYSPVRKTLFTYEEAIKFLGVLPENYNLVKALVGDKSDNLRGVKGVGVKTLLKVVPELLTDSNINLDVIFNRCEEHMKDRSICRNILTDWKLVESNFQIMNLHETVLNDPEKQLIVSRLKETSFKIYSGPFLAMLEEDCIDGLSQDVENWLKVNFSGLIKN